MEREELSEIEELKGVMEALNQTVPELLSKIMDSIYDKEKDKKLAAGTAEFYKSLKEAGMSEDKAFELTREYMKSRDPTNLIEEALGGVKGLGGGEISEQVQKKINEEMEKE